MGQEEFLISFKQALSGQIDDYKIQDHINYYRNYIRQQMASGKSEQEVLDELGNPRLLAKTIIEREKFATDGDASFREFNRGRNDERSYKNDAEDDYGNKRSSRTLHLPLWLVGLVAILAVALLIGAAFALISFFAPVILVALIAAGVYGIIRRVTG